MSHLDCRVSMHHAAWPKTQLRIGVRPEAAFAQTSIRYQPLVTTSRAHTHGEPPVRASVFVYVTATARGRVTHQPAVGFSVTLLSGRFPGRFACDFSGLPCGAKQKLWCCRRLSGWACAARSPRLDADRRMPCRQRPRRSRRP